MPSFFNTMQRNSIELQFFYKMTSVKFQKNKNPLMITVIVKKTQKPNSYQVLLSTFRTTRTPWSNDDCLGQYPCLFNYDQLDVFWLGLIDYVFQQASTSESEVEGSISLSVLQHSNVLKDSHCLGFRMWINGKNTTIHNGFSFSCDVEGITL